MEHRHDPELISALTDGELHGESLDVAVRIASEEPAGRQAWCSYHLIGEVIRSGAAPSMDASPEAFLARLQQRLDQEPLPVRPAAVEPAVVAHPGAAAANDGWWRLIAGVASVAALGAVAWNFWSAQPAATPQLAAAPVAPAPVVVQADPRAQAAMIRDPRLDQLLAAHRQLGGAGALQTSSGFLRNATYEGPAR
ncbi:sigma-E factor negative regulatory protein [Ramlibacter sp.]|uniref:sigma-E factor negative regulatory protein n=1 Tax=Ramlibacter sp. TaxID=1917967 RepID=UPI0035AFD09E